MLDQFRTLDNFFDIELPAEKPATTPCDAKQAAFVFSEGTVQKVRQYCQDRLSGKDCHVPTSRKSGEVGRLRDWVRRFEGLVVMARDYACAHITRDDLRFDKIKRKALALADEVFPTAERGLIFSRIAQIIEVPNAWRKIQLSGKAYSDKKKATKILKKKTSEHIDAVRATQDPTKGHVNSITNLKPAAKWTIVTDETGSMFTDNAFEAGVSQGAVRDGRMVFVLIPEDRKPPKLELGWHAANKPDQELVKVSMDLYKSKCGILGIPVVDLHPDRRDLWLSCVETLLELTVRLLPVEGETEIDLLVEQRSEISPMDSKLLGKLVDSVMFRLSLVNPERARQIQISLARFIAKKESPYNGYADLVAFSWGCGKSKRSLFVPFGWQGPCLVTTDSGVAQTFRRCLDLASHRDILSYDDWTSLVTCPDKAQAGSLIGALLRTFGEEARKQPPRWRKYLDYTVEHLNSKAIQLRTLKAQLAWLKEYEPAEETLSPRLRLLWLTVKLATANHGGGSRDYTAEQVQEFKELMASLKDEDAPLTCFAALHLAVEMTDRFEFEAARAFLQPWRDEPVGLCGLRYHGQVLSSLGQHEAFLGNNEQALAYFDQAIETFGRLSENAQGDIDHTLAYAVIAAMDMHSPRLGELFAKYLYGGEYSVETMVDMANQFAAVGENEPDSKYAHAILLRYLITLPVDDPVRTAYVACATDWQWSEDGHPWELIAFYRALLLGESHAGYRLWLRRGYDLAMAGGPVLKLIGLVIGAGLIGTATDAISPETYRSLISEVCDALPAIGDSRRTALCEVLNTPCNLLELAQKVLPFNLR